MECSLNREVQVPDGGFSWNSSGWEKPIARNDVLITRSQPRSASAKWQVTVFLRGSSARRGHAPPKTAKARPQVCLRLNRDREMELAPAAERGGRRHRQIGHALSAYFRRVGVKRRERRVPPVICFWHDGHSLLSRFGSTADSFRAMQRE